MKLQHAASRREFLRVTSAVVATIATTAVCTPNPVPPSASAPPSSPDVDALGRSHVRDHLGKAGESLLQSRVTRSSYIDRLRTRSSEFSVGDQKLPLGLDMTGALDLGGVWANDLMLSAPVAIEATNAVAEVIRRNTGDKVENAAAVFGHRRYLDVATSRQYKVPLLANLDSIIVFPGIAALATSPTPTAPSEIPLFYVLSRKGVRRVQVPRPSERGSIDDIVKSRTQRATSYLDHLVGIGQDDRVRFFRFKESPRRVQTTPAPGSSAIDGEVIYTEATVDTAGSDSQPAAATSSDSSTVVDGVRVPMAQTSTRDAGRFQLERQALFGEPSSTLQQRSNVAYGVPGSFPLPFAACAGSATEQVCDSCASTIWVSANGAIFGGLLACYKESAIAASACGPAYILCLLGLGLICTAVAAGLALMAGWMFDSARHACQTSYTI